MLKFAVPALMLALISSVTSAIAAGATTKPLPYKRAIDDMVEGASLNYGKAVRYCAGQGGTSGDSISKTFETFLENIQTGTRAGFIAAGAPDDGSSSLSPEDKAVASRMGNDLLVSVQAAPVQMCANLAAQLSSGTEAMFKEQVLESMKDYKQKRHALCTKIPRPTNCRPNE